MIKMEVKDFKTGDKVRFTDLRDGQIDNYHSSGIPTRLIIHGDTTLHNNYKTEHAEVVDVYGKYVIVKVLTVSSQYLQLGYLPDSLKHVFTTWKQRYMGE